MKFYKALQLRFLTYAAAACQTWTAPSHTEQLESCQNKALRKVTGYLKSAPTPQTLRWEAGICSIATASKRATVLAYEKAHQLPPDQPRRQILAAPSWHHLKRQSWRSAVQATTSNLPAELAHRFPLTPPSPTLGKIQATGVYTPTTCHLQVPEMIQPSICHPLFTFYNDGSATVGILGGGAGMVVTEGDPANPTILLTKQQRGAAITSPYHKEKAAMRMALQWLLPSHDAAAICTVS